MDPIQRRQVIEKDGEVLITGLPYKKGLIVEIVVYPQAEPPARLTVERLRQSGLIGMWSDREDIEDDSAYARRLREEAERRTGR